MNNFRTKARPVKAWQVTEDKSGAPDWVEAWIDHKTKTPCYRSTYAGDWIVQNEYGGHIVYGDDEFRDCFEPIE